MVPFHDLWRDGGETEKRPPYPPDIIESAQNDGICFSDTILALIIERDQVFLLLRR
jgi:hypothetical protein